jgi:hypothetical protein
MLQTKITSSNQLDFYKNVYHMQLDSRDKLINIEKFKSLCILVDCCGAHYRTQFNKNIIVLETIETAKNFALTKVNFDQLIDNRSGTQIIWPTITDLMAPVLIFDRSPMLKYLSLADLCNTVSDAAEKYQASVIVLRHHLFFVDDSRVVDRFYNFCNFKIKNYCIEKFSYDTKQLEYWIELRRVKHVE